MNDVFISYSRRDKVFTQKLYEALKAVNRAVWADWDSIPAASDWFAEIKEGIEQTDSVLFVLSPEWIKSNECRKELAYAVEMGKRLFPILYIPVDPKDVPPELAKINWVYLRDIDDFDQGFKTLCSAMDTDLEWIKTHTRIQVRALEWEKKNRNTSFVLRGQDLMDGEQFIAGAANKSPVPTTLQSEYILASRKDANRRQRLTLTGVTIALVISIALGAIALWQRGIAKDNENTAITNAQEAERQKGIAQENEKTAITNEQEAKRQAKISRAGELAAQSELLGARDFHISLLLGIESFDLLDNILTRGALLDAANANPHLLKFLMGHSSGVPSVAFSPDGKILASGSWDHTIILWDVAIGKRIRQLTGHKSDVNSVTFSPDGKMLASGSDDQTIILWDVATGTQISQFIGNNDIKHRGNILSVAYSPDGNMLASGSADQTIILWDVTTGNPIGQLIGHTSQVRSVAFSPKCINLPEGCVEMLASGSYDDHIILWNVATQQQVFQPLEGHDGDVFTVAFSPDGSTLASGSRDNTVILWNAATGELIRRLIGHKDNVLSVAFSPDGKILASGSLETTIILWDMETLQPIGQPLTGHSKPVASVAFSPDGKALASGGWDSKVILWNVPMRQPMSKLLTDSYSVKSIAVSPDDNTLASGSYNDEIILWDISKKQPIGKSLTGHTDYVNSVAFSPQDGGKILASGSGDHTVILWDVATQKPIGQPLQGHSNWVMSVAFSPNGKILASGSCGAKSADSNNCTQGEIILWDVATRRPIGKPLKGHSNWINSLAFNSDGKTLASGSGDGTVILWDVSEVLNGGETIPIDQPLKGHSNWVNSVAFSPDGKTLASGSDDNLIILWDVATHNPIGQPLTGHTGEVYNLTFSPDGKTLASGGNDNLIILWDVATRQPIGQPLAGHSTSVITLAFTPDGKTLASGSYDNTIILWDVSLPSWIIQSCERTGSNFTHAEWEKYFPNEDYRITCPQWPAGK